MYKLLAKVRKSKIFYILLLLVLILTPSAIYQTAESERLAITVAIGIDEISESDEIELDLVVLAPQSGNDINSNEILLSSTGTSISECVSIIENRLGKDIALSHCQVIILSENIASNNPMKYLDTFTRTNNLTTNTLIACSPDPKELLEAQVTMSSKNGINLSTILNKNTKSSFVADINLEKFYSQYFDESTTTYLPIIGTKESKNSNNTESANSQGSSNESSNDDKSSNQQSSNALNSSTTKSGEDTTIASSGSVSKEVDYKGEVALFSKGKMIKKLSKEEVAVLNILAPNVNKTSIDLDNITTEYATDAKFTINITDKTVTTGYSFVNGYPVVSFDVTLVCKISEINADKYYLDSITRVHNEISEQVENKIRDKVINQFAKYVNYSKDNFVDTFYLQKYFYRLYTKEWHDYKLSLDADSNYLERVIFLLNLNFIDQT